MADDLHYVHGDFYRICERTGFKVRARRTAKEWTGRIIRNESWEVRQPQDFVRGVVDDQTVPEPRPRQIDQFLGPLQTTMAANAPAGATSLFLVSTVRMANGDRLDIILDSKDSFLATILNVVTSSQIILTAPLPYSVSAGNLVTDLTALALPFIG